MSLLVRRITHFCCLLVGGRGGGGSKLLMRRPTVTFPGLDQLGAGEEAVQLEASHFLWEENGKERR